MMHDAGTGLEIIEFQEYRHQIAGTPTFLNEYYGYGKYKDRPVICSVLKIDDGTQCIVVAYVDEKDYFLHKLKGGTIGELFSKVDRYISNDGVHITNFNWVDVVCACTKTHPPSII